MLRGPGHRTTLGGTARLVGGCVLAACSASGTPSGASVDVMIEPDVVTVVAGTSQPFVAAVTGTNPAVTWSVEEGSVGGGISSTGVYRHDLGLWSVRGAVSARESRNGGRWQFGSDERGRRHGDQPISGAGGDPGSRVPSVVSVCASRRAGGRGFQLRRPVRPCDRERRVRNGVRLDGGGCGTFCGAVSLAGRLPRNVGAACIARARRRSVLAPRQPRGRSQPAAPDSSGRWGLRPQWTR